MTTAQKANEEDSAIDRAQAYCKHVKPFMEEIRLC